MCLSTTKDIWALLTWLLLLIFVYLKYFIVNNWNFIQIIYNIFPFPITSPHQICTSITLSLRIPTIYVRVKKCSKSQHWNELDVHRSVDLSCLEWSELRRLTKAADLLFSLLNGQTGADPQSSRPGLTYCVNNQLRAFRPLVYLWEWPPVACGSGSLGGYCACCWPMTKSSMGASGQDEKLERRKERERAPRCSSLIWQDADRLPSEESGDLEKQLCTMLFV